jgi:hypothetical protein
MKTAEGKRRISGGTFFKRLFWIALIVYVVVNPLDAATRAHDIAFWIRSWFG